MMWSIFLFLLSFALADSRETLEVDENLVHANNSEHFRNAALYLTKVSPLGDIRLTEEQERTALDFSRWPDYKWPRGIVIWWIEPGQFSYWEEYEIRNALKEMNCLLENLWIKEWKSWDDGGDYISIHKGNGCWSYVGRIGGEQKLSLGNGCIYRNTITHEMGHAIGFTHTQCRHDRDNHCRILWDNISDDWKGAYEKVNNDWIDIGNYEPYSCMHYPIWSPSHSGKDAFEFFQHVERDRVGGGSAETGGLTEEDRRKFDKLYAP